MLITIQDIAESICEDIGDTTQKYFTTLLKKCLQGYRDLHIFVTPSVCVKSIIVEADRIIPLPADFIYETKIGIMRGDRIATLFLNKELRIGQENRFTLTEAAQKIDNILLGVYVDGLTSIPFYNTFRGGEFVGELYGLGNGFHPMGYYNIDRAERTLLLSSGMLPADTELIIEYKSDGLPEGLRLVPSECEMAITFYAKWQWYIDRNPNLGIINRDEYRTEYGRLKSLYNARPIDFLAEIFVENHKSSPK
jgi:hypothetical protein